MKGSLTKKLQVTQTKSLPLGNDKKISSFPKSQKPIKFPSPQEELKYVQKQLQQRQEQLNKKQQMFKIEYLKNNNLKKELNSVNEEIEQTKFKITLDLLEKNKNNKESPLFYNQNGLSPIQLTLVEEKKYQNQMKESFVCMICFQDIEQNQIIIHLPCQHNFHKDCAIQHILGSKFCPNCSALISLVEQTKRKIH